MSDPKSFDTIEGVETSQEHPLTTKLGQVGRLFIIVQTDFAETNTRGKQFEKPASISQFDIGIDFYVCS